MGGQLATGASIYMASAGVPAADGAGLSSIKSFSQLLTSIAALPLAGGTLTGNLLFTDNTYDIGASGATRPRTVYAGTSVVTPLLSTASGNMMISPASGTTRFQSSAIDAVLQLDSGSLTRALQITQGGTVATISTTGSLRITSSVTGFELKPFNGYIEQWTSGSNGTFYVFDSSGGKSILTSHNGTDGLVTVSSGKLLLTSAASVSSTVPISSGVYTFATVPTASSYSGAAIRISDRSQQWAYSDGTDWRFFVDGAVIS